MAVKVGAPLCSEHGEQGGFETMTFNGGSDTNYSVDEVNANYKPILISGKSRSCNVVVNLEDGKTVSVAYKSNGSWLAPGST